MPLGGVIQNLAVAAVTLAAAMPAGAASPTRIWLLAEPVSGHWCATTDIAPKSVQHPGRFAGGRSAMIEHAGKSGMIVHIFTESEDAYVEDSYTLDRRGAVTAVSRRGHYLNDPYISVAYVPIGRTRFALTSQSRRLRRRSDLANRETYFLDWPVYRRFAQMPFADVATISERVFIKRRC